MLNGLLSRSPGTRFATKSRHNNPVGTPVCTRVVQTPQPTPPLVAANEFEACILRHTSTVTPATHPEVLELRLEGIKDGKQRAALADQIEIAKLDLRYHRVNLKGLLGETKPVTGTGNLPVIAIYGIGHGKTVRRHCVVTTHNASNHRGGTGMTLAGNQFAVKFGNFSKSVSGKEDRFGESGHWEIRWQATLSGTLPEVVASKLGATGLLEAGAEDTHGGAVIPAAGTTTVVLAAPAEYGATETFDPAVLRVRHCLDGNVVAWYDTDIRTFDMVPSKS